MTKWKRFGPMVGLLVVCVITTTYALGLPPQEKEQALPAAVGDLTTATIVEVRRDGVVVLSGHFGPEIPDGDEVKRTTALAPASGDTAQGTAEVEFDADNRGNQEIEIEVKGLDAKASYEVYIDNQLAGPLHTDVRGRSEVEFRRGDDTAGGTR